MRVKYNGKNEYLSECTNPDVLRRGKTYTVSATILTKRQINFRLVGVEGEFNSIWFDPIEEKKKPVFQAISNRLPYIAECFKCRMLIFNNGEPEWEDITTSPVETITVLGDNFYKIITVTGVYYTRVNVNY